MGDARTIAENMERNPVLPKGAGERFAGYAVMSAPFRSGHLLAMRRFVASSLGPGYTSVWHRAPGGAWTFFSDVPPLEGCARYFGAAIARAEQTPIEIEWTGPQRFVIRIPSVELNWELHLGTIPALRLLNVLAGSMPDAMWHSEAVLRAVAGVASRLLGGGRMGLTGRTPNGQRFIANPMRIWTVDSYAARLGDEDFGLPGPLPEQARLGDLYLPQRALFAVARAFLLPTEASRSVRPYATAALQPL